MFAEQFGGWDSCRVWITEPSALKPEHIMLLAPSTSCAQVACVLPSCACRYSCLCLEADSGSSVSVCRRACMWLGLWSFTHFLLGVVLASHAPRCFRTVPALCPEPLTAAVSLVSLLHSDPSHLLCELSSPDFLGTANFPLQWAGSEHR